MENLNRYKFRAWSIKDKFMDDTPVVYKGSPCTIDTEGKIVWLPENDTILMQYTGIKDKNGVEIYEGDIIVIENYTKEFKHQEPPKNYNVFAVEWNRYLWAFDNKIIYMPLSDYNLKTLEPFIFEVIGNIYQNPELLN